MTWTDTIKKTTNSTITQATKELRNRGWRYIKQYRTAKVCTTAILRWI